MVGAEQQAANVKTSKFFEIKIKIEKSCYLPGEQVNGIVIMHIIEPFIARFTTTYTRFGLYIL